MKILYCMLWCCILYVVLVDASLGGLFFCKMHTYYRYLRTAEQALVSIHALVNIAVYVDIIPFVSLSL